LLGAAHAACFTMAFSFACDKAGFATEEVDTTAKVSLIPDGEGFLIDRIALTLDAKVPGIDAGQFQQIAEAAKRGCPLSKALGSVGSITLVATLKS
jgi:osmotically inducible protein OsmC